MIRTIAVKVEATQSAEKFENVEVNTLGEVKQLLRDKGYTIDDDSTEWHCAQSRSVMKEDDAPLPTNVPWRGSTTNDLIFKVVATRDKIKLGALKYVRSELYAQVKEYGLEEEVKNHFGKNFTQVSSADLYEFLNNYVDSCNECEDCMECEEQNPVEEFKDYLRSLYISEEGVNLIINYVVDNFTKVETPDTPDPIMQEIDDAFNY